MTFTSMQDNVIEETDSPGRGSRGITSVYKNFLHDLTQKKKKEIKIWTKDKTWTSSVK